MFNNRRISGGQLNNNFRSPISAPLQNTNICPQNFSHVYQQVISRHQNIPNYQSQPYQPIRAEKQFVQPSSYQSYSKSVSQIPTSSFAQPQKTMKLQPSPIQKCANDEARTSVKSSLSISIEPKSVHQSNPVSKTHLLAQIDQFMQPSYVDKKMSIYSKSSEKLLTASELIKNKKTICKMDLNKTPSKLNDDTKYLKDQQVSRDISQNQSDFLSNPEVSNIIQQFRQRSTQFQNKCENQSKTEFSFERATSKPILQSNSSKIEKSPEIKPLQNIEIKPFQKDESTLNTINKILNNLNRFETKNNQLELIQDISDSSISSQNENQESPRINPKMLPPKVIQNVIVPPVQQKIEDICKLPQESAILIIDQELQIHQSTLEQQNLDQQTTSQGIIQQTQVDLSLSQTEIFDITTEQKTKSRVEPIAGMKCQEDGGNIYEQAAKNVDAEIEEIRKKNSLKFGSDSKILLSPQLPSQILQLEPQILIQNAVPKQEVTSQKLINSSNQKPSPIKNPCFTIEQNDIVEKDISSIDSIGNLDFVGEMQQQNDSDKSIPKWSETKIQNNNSQCLSPVVIFSQRNNQENKENQTKGYQQQSQMGNLENLTEQIISNVLKQLENKLQLKISEEQSSGSKNLQQRRDQIKALKQLSGKKPSYDSIQSIQQVTQEQQTSQFIQSPVIKPIDKEIPEKQVEPEKNERRQKNLSIQSQILQIQIAPMKNDKSEKQSTKANENQSGGQEIPLNVSHETEKAEDSFIQKINENLLKRNHLNLEQMDESSKITQNMNVDLFDMLMDENYYSQNSQEIKKIAKEQSSLYLIKIKQEQNKTLQPSKREVQYFSLDPSGGKNKVITSQQKVNRKENKISSSQQTLKNLSSSSSQNFKQSFLKRQQEDLSKRNFKIQEQIKQKKQEEQRRLQELKNYIKAKEERIKKKSFHGQVAHQRLFQDAIKRKESSKRVQTVKKENEELIFKIMTDRRIMNNLDKYVEHQSSVQKGKYDVNEIIGKILETQQAATNLYVNI